MVSSPKILVVILGASEFPSLKMEANPAFLNSAEAVADQLRGEKRGPGTYRVENLFNADYQVSDLAPHLQSIFRRHADAVALILYYVGHGGFTRGREYFLALRSTRKRHEDLTGLRATSFATLIDDGFTGPAFVILDACFAGEAVNAFQSPLGDVVESQTVQAFPATGTSMLIAASKDKPAISPGGQALTVFTEALLETLVKGVPGGTQYLSLTDVAERLRRLIRNRYPDDDMPLPEVHSPRQTDGNNATWPLFANPAWSPSGPPPSYVVPPSPIPVSRTSSVPTQGPKVSQSHGFKAFRSAIRRVKVTSQLDDSISNDLIRLLEDGERYYRFAHGFLEPTPGWQNWARLWRSESGAVEVQLHPRAVGKISSGTIDGTDPWDVDEIDSDAIIDILSILARLTRGRTGIGIPLHEFDSQPKGKR